MRDAMSTELQTSDSTVVIDVNGHPLQTPSGLTVVAALLAADQLELRTHLVTGERRGAFCGMGICWECAIEIDGVPETRACMTLVRNGMCVKTDGRR